jgi:hypothetical protein
MKIFREANGYSGPLCDPALTRAAVAGILDADWHDVNGIKIGGSKMEQNQIGRVTRAISAIAVEDNGGQEPTRKRTVRPKRERGPKGPTISGLIKDMILKGECDDTIADAIRSNFPDSVGARKTGLYIVYYKKALAKEGKINYVPAPKGRRPGQRGSTPDSGHKSIFIQEA